MLLLLAAVILTFTAFTLAATTTTTERPLPTSEDDIPAILKTPRVRMQLINYWCSPRVRGKPREPGICQWHGSSCHAGHNRYICEGLCAVLYPNLATLGSFCSKGSEPPTPRIPASLDELEPYQRTDDFRRFLRGNFCDAPMVCGPPGIVCSSKNCLLCGFFFPEMGPYCFEKPVNLTHLRWPNL